MSRQRETGVVPLAGVIGILKAANPAQPPTRPTRLPIRLLTQLYDLAHAAYKRGLSPLLHATSHTLAPGGCRFQPTCSEYATLAVAQHGIFRGAWLAATRLLRCHPFSQGGWDPVPLPSSVPRLP